MHQKVKKSIDPSGHATIYPLVNLVDHFFVLSPRAESQRLLLRLSIYNGPVQDSTIQQSNHYLSSRRLQTRDNPCVQRRTVYKIQIPPTSTGPCSRFFFSTCSNALFMTFSAFQHLLARPQARLKSWNQGGFIAFCAYPSSTSTADSCSVSSVRTRT
ncbi:hypothetical protein BDW67DRAFT_155184 [Aspergillus spinulosporus]